MDMYGGFNHDGYVEDNTSLFLGCIKNHETKYIKITKILADRICWMLLWYTLSNDRCLFLVPVTTTK